MPAADLIDGATGNPISGPLAITLSFPNYPRVITEGTVPNLALDFNLSASNTAVLNASPTTVAVNPALSATLAPDTSKLIHVRSPLVSLSTARSDCAVQVWPFEDKGDSFGEVTAALNADLANGSVIGIAAESTYGTITRTIESPGSASSSLPGQCARRARIVVLESRLESRELLCRQSHLS